jgi:hypothetical protein
MNTSNTALNKLIDLMDTAVKAGAQAVRNNCITWLSGISRGQSANEPLYSPITSVTRRYRKGAKKGAKVATIHSILSRKCQKVLSEEIGSQAAWLLGLWPRMADILGAKTLTPSQYQ